MKQDLGNWQLLVEKKPQNGQDVLLFLGDRRIIRVKWSQPADDMAIAIGISREPCYPLLWCDTEQLKEINNVTAL